MRENEGQSGETPQGRNPFTVFAIWEQLGVTEHLGGLAATRRLLDIGCGIGYTACLLAKRYQVEVIAADISPGVLAWANKRREEQGVSENVTLVEADAHALPFPENTFDAVIAESVLVFCDQQRVSAEVLRVLKRGGIFGANDACITLWDCSSTLVGRRKGSSFQRSGIFRGNFNPVYDSSSRTVAQSSPDRRPQEILLLHLQGND